MNPTWDHAPVELAAARRADEDDQDRYIEARAIKDCPLREPCFLYGICYAEKNGRPDLCDLEKKP